MCSTPKMPSTSTTTKQEAIQQPTQADAAVSKASAIERTKTASLAGRDTKTSARGLADTATNKKKQLLGE